MQTYGTIKDNFLAERVTFDALQYINAQNKVRTIRNIIILVIIVIGIVISAVVSILYQNAVLFLIFILFIILSMIIICICEIPILGYQRHLLDIDEHIRFCNLYKKYLKEKNSRNAFAVYKNYHRYQDSISKTNLALLFANDGIEEFVSWKGGKHHPNIDDVIIPIKSNT